MDFLSNVADSTPLVGTIKGLYHYARGEEEKGDEAMYQSTRSTAVIAGGIFGGPAGAVGAGLATDAAASGLMKKEKGLVNSCKNIAEDIEAGKNPTGSIASASFQVVFDGVSGYGGLSRGAGNASTKAFGKTMQRGGEQIIQKSVRISSAEAAKMVGRKASERAAAKVAERAFMASAHVGFRAAQRTDLEERERKEREWEERERERQWRKREREREKREKEQREREWREREQSEREWRERQQREREWRERQQREREWREQEQRVREWREQEQRVREWREQEQREREYNEQEQRERAQQKSNKQQESKKKEQRANNKKQQRDTSGLNSGSPQPPQDNKNNNKKCGAKDDPSFFETFMTLLRKILKLVYNNESEPFSSIFGSLPKEQRDYLKKVLKPITKSGTLEAVIELVIRMFKQHFHKDISFLNFLSLLEFVQTYVTDELLERTRISSGTETEETKMKPNERREKIISEIVSEKDIVEKLTELFNELKTEIEAENAKRNSIFHNFRDIFAAVYHYFKHRRLPADGRILSVGEYYDWISKLLQELKPTQGYILLKNAMTPNYVYEPFVPIFRRRFKIVLSLHGNKIVLSSAFVVTMMHPDDKEKHAIIKVAEVVTGFLITISLLFVFMKIILCVPILLLNIPLIIFNCIAFMVKLLLNTLLFFFACFIFLLKLFFYILLSVMFVWYLFFYLPDQR